MQEPVMAQLMDFFESNDELKIFSMNGSKTNKNIPDDLFKDYDVVFFTEDVSKYKRDSSFLKQFGEILLFTEPEVEAVDPMFPQGNGYIYLVQYTNGVRIDIQFRALDQLNAYLKEDSLTQIIADKEGMVQNRPIPNDSDYWLKPPTQVTFTASVKEFWWEMNNTLKAALRGEFLLAQFYLELTREELILLMTWTVALDHGYERNYGKKYTGVLHFLSAEERQVLMEIFDTGATEKIYHSLKKMKQLEENYLPLLGEACGFDYQELVSLNEVPVKYLRSKNQHELAAYFESQERKKWQARKRKQARGERMIETNRLILREMNSSDRDMEALFAILSDEDVNAYLPWFPLKNVEEAKVYFQQRIQPKYNTKDEGYYFAVCKKTDNKPIGYVAVSGDESRDFGYGLRKDFWNQGIITEAAKAVIDFLKAKGWSYITATHDRQNPASGAVMRKLGMTYKYSYKEQWQPKDISVIFRMYQQNFDGKDRTYQGYWEKYPEHFIEETPQ